MKSLFLIRHAAYASGPDPQLSELGKAQSLISANQIKAELNGEEVIIWTSPAKRAQETAEIIKKMIRPKKLLVKEKLWSGKGRSYDFDWLKKELNDFQGENLIIVSHLEYVREFPVILGFSENDAGYAEGVLIRDGVCINLEQPSK